MLNRFVSLLVCLSVAASVACFGQGNQGKGYIFELPGPNIPGTHLQGWDYSTNTLNPVFDANGPTSGYRVIPVPNGSKFYILGTGTGGIQSVDPAFTTFRSINGISGNILTAEITLDGKYLFVGSSTGLYVLDTTSDAIVPNTVPTTGDIVGIAMGRDQKTAYVLSNAAFGSFVSAVTLSNLTRNGPAFALPFGGATSITVSPLGLLYVTEINRIYEIDPATMQLTSNGEIAIVATPGPLVYTPDGTTAYVTNSSPSTGGQSLLKVNLQNHQVATWPVFNSGITPPVFDKVVVVSKDLIFAHSTLDTTLWDVTPAPFGAAPSTVLAGAIPVTSVLSVDVSNELPNARFLYALLANGNQTNMVRVDMASKTASFSTLAVLGNGLLQFATIPPQTGVGGFITYNQVQNVAANATSAPLIARVLDSTGRPMYNVPVTFTADNAAVVISNAAQTTGLDGFVQTTAKLPADPATYTVTLSAGGQSVAFTLTIAGPNGNPSGGPNNQVSIVIGNGMFLQALSRSPLYAPLTIQVNDTNGKPLPNVPVTFTVTGPGAIDLPTSTTDANGQTFTDLLAEIPQQGVSFQAIKVNASTPVGSVDFTATTFILNLDGTGQPQVNILNPGADRIITAGEGDVVADGIVASIHSSVIPDIGKGVPGVGVRIADGADVSLPGPASCQGNSLSDNLGNVHCNLVASCKAGPGTYGVQLVVGEYRAFPAILKIVPGSTRTLSIASGDKQAGRSGDLLPLALVANATDNCGTPIPGVNVSWKVTQGSASLSNTVNVSDAGGHVSTRVTLGQIAGPVQVSVSIGTSSQVVFNLTNNITITGITLVSGGGQSASANQAFQQPVVFVVKDANGNAVPNVNVTFSVTAGSASVNPAAMLTNAQGQASTTVTAGNSPGSITITAAYAGLTSTASLTVKAVGPAITASSFFNTASFQVGLVPCGLNTVVGSGIAPNVSGTVLGNPLGFGPLPYTLQGLSITVNAIPAPIQSISNINGTQQATFQTPCETVAGSATTVVITVNGATTTVTGVQVFTYQPGIFTYAGPNNKLYGAVIRKADGSYVTPSNQAHRGENYYLVVTGLGQISPPITTNSAGTGQAYPINQLVVGVNNAGVPVISAQYVAGSIGVYIIEFQIPANAPTGADQPLAVGVIQNGQTVFGNSVFIPGVI